MVTYICSYMQVKYVNMQKNMSVVHIVDNIHDYEDLLFIVDYEDRQLIFIVC